MWAAAALLVILLSELVVSFVLVSPLLVEFRALVVVLPLAVALAAGVAAGTRGGGMAGAIGGLYALSVLVRYSSDNSLPTRVATGVVVGGTIFALALYVGWARASHERLSGRLLDAERERARALEAHNRDLASTNQVLQDFAHVVAHDLKEPVRGIGAMLDALDEDEGDRLTPEGRALLARAQAADRRLGMLVEALLDYARATRVQPSDLRPVDIRETLASDLCRARFANLLQERGARLIAPPPEGQKVLGAPNAMSLILGNLITNAIRHNPAAAPTVRVRVEPSSGGRAAVVVEDDGPGFSPESLERLRDVLAGREQTIGVGRSGFGLLLVARAAERMGGRLHMGRSSLGGAEVRVELPADGAPPAAAEDAQPPAPDEGGPVERAARGADPARRRARGGGARSLRPT